MIVKQCSELDMHKVIDKDILYAACTGYSIVSMCVLYRKK